MSVFPFTATDTGSSITDSVAVKATRTLADTAVTFSGSIARNAATRTRTAADTGATVSESIVRVHRYVRLPADSIGSGDTLSFHAVQPFRVAVDTGASVNDSLNAFTIGRIGVDAYADGPSLIFGAALSSPYRLSIFADVFPIYTPPDTELEVYYARLPFTESQRKFNETVPTPRTAVNANCSWHGLLVDVERGSFALARAGGLLESLIGSRVKITKRGSSGRVFVVAYMHGVADLDERDELSIPRRLFLALSVLGNDRIPVTVEKLQ